MVLMYSLSGPGHRHAASLEPFPNPPNTPLKEDAMRALTQLTSVLTALGASVLLTIGCGGSGSDHSTTTPATNGSMSVTLVDGPTTDYKAINLNIQSIQIHQSATPDETGWTTVASPNTTVNLLALQGGVVEALASNKIISLGTYQMMRLVLGSGNTITLADNSIVALTVPSGQQTGIKIPLNFTVQAGTTADVWIDFDGAHSIHVVGTGSGSYILRPVVHGFMQAATGSASGTLTGPANIPLPGAVAMAESIDVSGNVTILRSAITNATGAYSLNLLPIGQAFYVVSQPVVGSSIYGAQASGAITLTTSLPTATANLSFTLAAGSGGAGGTLTPTATASQSDTMYLLQTVPNGTAGTAMLVIDSVNAVVGTGSETYSFLLIPMGNYEVQGTRSTLNADGTTTVTRSTASASFAVAAAATTTQNLSF